MMDSFNMNLLPNPARLRESYVSTLTACLGLAEALWAPEAYVAGVDLSFAGDAASHPYGTNMREFIHWQTSMAIIF